MNPAEHLAMAEAILGEPPDPTMPGADLTDMAMSINALAHAVIALAAEFGVPHNAQANPGVPDGH